LFERAPSAELHDTAELLWLASPIASPLCNGVFRATLASHRVAAVIDAVLARHAELRSPLLWWIGPSSRPLDLAERLIGRGFRLLAEEPGMAIDLTTLGAGRAPAGDFEVVTVTDAATLREWIDVAGDEDPVYAEGCGEVYAPDCFADDADLRLFVGRLNDEPVAASLLFTGGGVASVQNVITLPSVRRRGFGTVMTLTALRCARERGHASAVLTATPMAARVYEQLGFRRLCSFTVLQWDGKPT
jgi:GNAT superfamily N-acetyltransferase